MLCLQQLVPQSGRWLWRWLADPNHLRALCDAPRVGLAQVCSPCCSHVSHTGSTVKGLQSTMWDRVHTTPTSLPPPSLLGSSHTGLMPGLNILHTIRVTADARQHVPGTPDVGEFRECDLLHRTVKLLRPEFFVLLRGASSAPSHRGYFAGCAGVCDCGWRSHIEAVECVQFNVLAFVVLHVLPSRWT